VFVDAAAGFVAESSGRDELVEEGARSVAVVVEPVGEDVHDEGAGVEADEVGEAEGSHGEVAAELHDAVDGFGFGDAFHPCVEGFVDHGHEDAVGDEAGAIVCDEGCFAEFFGEVAGALDDGGVGLESGDDLDESHDGDGVEEVHSDDAGAGAVDGVFGGAGEFGDADGGGVGAERDVAALLEHVGEVGEDSLLGVGVFDDGFDDPVGFGDGVEVAGVGDAGESGVGVVLLHAAFFDGAGKELLVSGFAAVELACVGVVDDGVESRRGGDLRDAAAHLSSSDDRDRLDVRHLILLSRFDLVERWAWSRRRCECLARRRFVVSRDG